MSMSGEVTALVDRRLARGDAASSVRQLPVFATSISASIDNLVPKRTVRPAPERGHLSGNASNEIANRIKRCVLRARQVATSDSPDCVREQTPECRPANRFTEFHSFPLIWFQILVSLSSQSSLHLSFKYLFAIGLGVVFSFMRNLPHVLRSNLKERDSGERLVWLPVGSRQSSGQRYEFFTLSEIRNAGRFSNQFDRPSTTVF